MKTILILEDNDERIAGFQKAVAGLGGGWELKIWRDAPSMIAGCPEFFPTAALIGLDHDLNPQPGVTTNPGTGLAVAQFLADFLPVCPVLLHSSNTERVYSMLNELRFANWRVDRVGPLGTDWIETTWLKRARELMAESGNTWRANLPADHHERVLRMQLSLDGLGLDDALGEMLSYQSVKAARRLAENDLPAGPWFHTDDTEMAISIVAVLKSHGELNQDALARRFARRFERDPDRGYGSMTRIQLREINAGAKWRDTAAQAFGGWGSLGNGAAMRVAPLGAYFADDLAVCADAARASALVTHTHPEGVAGAGAVAVAAAMAWQLRAAPATEYARPFFAEILRHNPESQVRRGILLGSQTPAAIPVRDAAKALGNGSLVTAPDTVPFCLWMAAHHPRQFVEALGKTISADGDCDTNAAIVGGIVALSAGRESIPVEWLNARGANSNLMKPILLTFAGNPENQDRGLIIPDVLRTVLCIADGAGGRSGGREAAIMAVEFVRQNAALANDAGACVDLLRQLDAAISMDEVAGETTCVLAVLTPDEVFGASVGDSGAWLIPTAGELINLTQGQQRKPFIGSGSAWPMPFRCETVKGKFLLATDGLLKYTSADRIMAVCRENPTEMAAQRLVELVRYPSGGLPDDVMVIVAEI